MKISLSDWCKITDALEMQPEASVEDVVKKIKTLQRFLIVERKKSKEKSGPHFTPGEKAQAVDDSRIIAAAPELLEACKFMHKQLNMDTPTQWQKARANLKQAIAKAEGRKT